jgi:DNA-binding Lrp family transcriptional regulator
VAVPRRPPPRGAMLLRIKVLRGKIEAITRALAAREDVALIDVSASGNELNAVLLSTGGPRNALVFQALPATTAVAEVDAQTILHVFSAASDWRLDCLTDSERERIGGPPSTSSEEGQSDEPDEAIVRALADDARLPAASVARTVRQAESTTRRRMNALFDDGRLCTQVIVDPTRLGLSVDATLRMQVPPPRLDAVGHQLSQHPSVHGAVATTGVANLHVAVWLHNLDDLYRFVTEELGQFDVATVDTMIIDHAAKRPVNL